MTKKLAFIGCQVGDEGKAKALSYLLWQTSKNLESSSFPPGLKPIVVERYQGGSNAGHTEIVGGQEYKLHQVPSGIPFPLAYNLIGSGVFLNPRKAKTEIEELRTNDLKVSAENLGIAANAHVTLDYHVRDDQAAFQKSRHTSTGNGIKQTAMDKVGRTGIRFAEFLDERLVKEILTKRESDSNSFSTEAVLKLVDSYAAEREFLTEFLVNETEARKKHGSLYWMGEGAQGFLIDMDEGLYPGVTSSNPARVPNRPDLILGVVKLYTSSVGGGDRPFIGRYPENLERVLRDAWKERGTTTGKDRDLSPFDAVAVRQAVQAIQVDYLVGTCGDRMEKLAALGEKPKIVVAYEIDGRRFTQWDTSFYRRDTLQRAQPVFEEFEPWEKFTEEDGQTLTLPAEKYIERIESLVGRKFILLGTGPAQEQMLVYKGINLF